jgi:hypothetical protein
MAYTATWNESSPANTDLVSSADDEMRNDKVATRERLSTIVGRDLNGLLNTDPFIPAGYGLLNPKRYFPFFEHFTSQRDSDIVVSSLGVITDSGADVERTFLIPLDVTGYSVLTSMSFYYQRPADCIGWNAILYRATYGLGTVTDMSGTITLPVGNYLVAPAIESGFGPLEIDPGYYWFIVMGWQTDPTPLSQNIANAVLLSYA